MMSVMSLSIIRQAYLLVLIALVSPVPTSFRILQCSLTSPGRNWQKRIEDRERVVGHVLRKHRDAAEQRAELVQPLQGEAEDVVVALLEVELAQLQFAAVARVGPSGVRVGRLAGILGDLAAK